MSEFSRVRAPALVAALAGLACLGIALPSHAQTNISVVEIGPKQSSLDPSDPDGASGGRVNGLAIVPGDKSVIYAAAEWGGLFKSEDAGLTWNHLAGHTPHATWDIEVEPSDADIVYATSFYDGRIDSRAGIGVSRDGGLTWAKPPSATPPENFCTDPIAREEPAAFGVAADPDAEGMVYVGTNCGIAISTDAGVSWSFVDPSPSDGGADRVWDVVVHHGGAIDTCGEDGHRRSTDGGATWSTPTGINRLPAGICSIAASPDGGNVLFAVVGTTIFESVDGGGSWFNRYNNPRAQGRIPFVATNDRAGSGYDLWFGDVQLHRTSCTTPTTAGPGPRCQTTWTGPFTRSAGAHDDTGAILFDSGATVDACPVLMSSDGGVYVNTRNSNPTCHTPIWEQPNRTPQAVWNFDMAGSRRLGNPPEDLYFGNQDTGTFGTLDGGANAPTWTNESCCDGFDVVAEQSRVLSTVCCFGGARPTRLFISAPGMSGASSEINDYPPGNLRSFQQLDSIVNFGSADYAIITDLGVFVTTDVTANPTVWTQLGAGSTPFRACGIQLSRAGTTPVFFVKSGGECNGEGGGGIWRHDGAAAGGTWTQVVRPGAGQFGLFAVDPNDANRILASDLGGVSGPEMVITTDGGATWNNLPQLDTLMTGAGVFRYLTRTGPTRFTGFNGYPQPTLVAFDPFDPDIVVAAGADSGVFVSLDGATTFTRMTDPLDPGVSGVPHVPRARYAHFDHDTPEVVRIYLGTQGRGQWRISFRTAPEWVIDCGRQPWLCGRLVELERDLLVVECPVRGCMVFDPLPKNCLVKWDCPGCGPSGLCPPFYNLIFHDPENVWDMTVLDREGREAKMTRTRLQESTVLSLRPDKEQFIDGQIGDYTLALRMNRNGKPGVPYKIRTTLKVGDRPIGEAEAADALLSVVPAAGPPE